MAVPLSVIVPIRNEAANLARCLQSVRWADEIWVVDSGSSDGSQTLAEQAGAKVVQFAFNGLWPKKKNWALAELPLLHPWVFLIDADEVLPAEAEQEFNAIVSDPGHPIDGYWINRRFMFMGKWLKHAYYPNWNLRLFRHRLGRFERLAQGATASGDNEVHEHVLLRGSTGRLRSEMDHYAFPSIEIFVEKHNRYSNWEARVAEERRAGQPGPRLRDSPAGWRRRFKILSERTPFRPTLRFLYIYLGQRGFLDGREGYYFARLHALYELLCVIKQRELRSHGRMIPGARPEGG